MATTRIIAMHRNKGYTVEQALKARLDYIKNPEKTREGRTGNGFCLSCSNSGCRICTGPEGVF